MRLLRETRPSHLIADFAVGGLSKLDLGTALPSILSSRLNQRAARMGNKVSCVRAIGTAGRFGLNPGLSSRAYSSVAGDLFTVPCSPVVLAHGSPVALAQVGVAERHE